MLKNIKLDYYAIVTAKNEYQSSTDEIFNSLKAAKKHAMEYADWFCQKGTCTIKHYRLDETTKYGPNEVEYWKVWNGSIVEHKVWANWEGKV